jgi:hypothetical protein
MNRSNNGNNQPIGLRIRDRSAYEGERKATRLVHVAQRKATDSAIHDATRKTAIDDARAPMA